jgi:RHS repeat-associated protein
MGIFMGKLFHRHFCSVLFLLTLVFAPALATAQTALVSGQQVSGTIVGTSIDNYTFTAQPSNLFTFLIRQAGTDSAFSPNWKGFDPMGFAYNFGSGYPYYSVIVEPSALPTGNWTAQVSSSFGVNGSYSIMFFSMPGTGDVCCGYKQGPMYASATYFGSLYRTAVSVYTFNSVAAIGSDAPTITLNVPSGSIKGIAYDPSGTNAGGIAATNGTGTLNFGPAGILAGKYTLLLYRPDTSTDTTTSYTISIAGNSLRNTEVAKVNGSRCGSCHSGNNAVAGEPVNLANGDLYEGVTDYTTVGTNALAFARSYNSLSQVSGVGATTLGPNWRSNYDRYLMFPTSSLAAAQRPDGQVINFTSVSGVWTPDTDTDYVLFSSGSNWILTDSDDTTESYSSAGSLYRVDSIKLRNGYTQTLNYSSSTGLLTSVNDSYGRTLGLSYTSGNLTGVTTPDTLALTYGYTMFASANVLTSVSYNTSPVTHQSYLYENTNYPWALTGITDENGNRFITWTYDIFGRVTSSENALGANHTSISYDDSTGNRTVTGPLGIQETYKFTTLQGIPKLSEIDRAANSPVAAATRLFTYDANGYQKSETDWNGNLTTYVNNSHGDPTQIIFASGSAVAQTTNVVYDTTFVHLPKTISTFDSITTLSYDSSGNVLTRAVKDQASQSVPYFTSGTNRNWTYTWSSTGQLLTAQLPRTDVTAKTTYTYTSGTLTKISNALAQATNILTYTSGGYPKTITDPNSVLTTLSYNPRMWLTSSVLTLSSAHTLTTTLAYDSAGNLTKYTLPDNSYLAYGYDAAHRVQTITNPLSETQTLTYNSANNVTQSAWKDASSSTVKQHSASFDPLGRMMTDVGGMSQTTVYTHDSMDNVIAITDPLGSMTTMAYDSANRMVTSTDPLTNKTQYTYDQANRTLSVTDPRSKVTNYTYDGYGEQIQVVSPDNGTTVLHFDSDGNVTSQTDASSAVTNATYDALDRILTRTYPADSTLNVAFSYDSAGHGDGIGRLTSLTDQAGSLSLNYEERGLVTANNRTIGGNAYNTGFAYQSAGRIATLTYASSGWAVGYTYDAAGQVTTVTDKPPSLAAVNIATSVTHMPFGPVKSMTYGNGITDARTYDLDYRTTAIKDLNGASGIYYSSFGYNANDNVISITDNVAAANNQTLQYNSSNWLKFASGSYGTSGLSLSYDSSGNRTAYSSTTYTVGSTSNHLTAIGANSLTFSSTGNITALPGLAATYNKANQLATAVVSGSTSTNLYDAFGNRISLVVGTARSNVMSYGQSNELLTEANGGVKTDYAYLDGFPIAAIQPAASTVSALHTDYLGTVQKDTNSAKTVVWTGAYDPNGVVTPTTSITMNLRFPGQYADASGLYHNGFRDYLPKFASGGGRYLESDPVGLDGGINPYIYTLNNPYRFVDRLGLDIWVEERSGREPSFHESINVGDPNGKYESFSFGKSGKGFDQGVVYRDTTHGGQITEYKKTTPAQDEAFLQYLSSQEGKTGLYMIDDFCVSFSRRMFREAPGAVIEPPPYRKDAPFFINTDDLGGSTARSATGSATATGIAVVR